MKCQYCNNNAGFMKTYHIECKAQVEQHLLKIEEVVNAYKEKTIGADKAKKTLIDLALANALYKNYLWNTIVNESDIRTDEVLIYVETEVSVLESKNWKTMVRTGLSYARYPVWEEKTLKVDDVATVAFTDKSIYILGLNHAIVYPYEKIINLGYEESWRRAYFDVKTTSACPHRYSIEATSPRNDVKAKSIALILNCLRGWEEAER